MATGPEGERPADVIGNAVKAHGASPPRGSEDYGAEDTGKA